MSRFAYLHGFASGPLSRKGQHLARVFAERGRTLELPDLNRPCFERLSSGAALGAVDELARGGDSWSLVGSSFGGWIAARWAELHPERLRRLVLLCPGFDLAARWPLLVGPARMALWEERGALPMADGAGHMVPVHWAFYTECRAQPAWPEVPCETLVLHGTRDEVVPIETSRRYAAARPHVRLIELDDDHSLAASIDRVTAETLAFFEL